MNDMETQTDPHTGKKKTQLLTIIVVGVIIVLLATIFILNPFQSETQKVETLRDLGKNEQEAENVTSGINEFIKTEEALQDIDNILEEFQTDAN